MNQGSEVIRSKQNAELKRIRAVARGKDRDWVLLEGRRLVMDAIQAGLEMGIVLADEGRITPEDLGDLGKAAAALRWAEGGIMQGLGSLKTTPRVMALARPPEVRGPAELGDFLRSSEGAVTVLALAGVTDPGNLGALARSAEAFGARALVLAGEDGARPFGPKALRGSMGSLLRLPVFEIESVRAAIDLMGASGVQQCTAKTRGALPLPSFAFAERTVIWMTGETGDAPPAFEDLEGVTIPMQGSVESLNVNVAGSLLLFERSRRRGLEHDSP